MIRAVKGTRDIFTPEVQKWQFVERKAREICALYGYEEIRTPVLESTELFTRGIGEITDIVTKQMFTFSVSHDSVTLRPEGTAPVARAYVEHGLDNEPSITKWYYVGPMFRHERPQKGRYWQFGQFGIEALGTDSPAVDAEVIELLIRYIESAGATQHELHLNSVGCSVCRPIYTAKLQELLRERKEEMCADCQVRIEKNPLRVLDCKVEKDQPIVDALPAIDEYLCEECRAHFQTVQKFLGSSGIQFIRNKRLVRGLDYYTKTTFEVLLPGLGAQNSVAGGGRYDGLVEELGGKPVNAIGFALGLDRLVLAVPESSAEPSGVSVFIVSMSDLSFNFAYNEVQARLRKEGIACEVDYQRRSVKAAMRQADKRKVEWVILVGDDEIQEGKVTLKNMKNGEQQRYSLNEVIQKLV
ncbi:histidine--tRNA ligase [bacterium]|nr:histidine--tRNA ligase [bacterium]